VLRPAKRPGGKEIRAFLRRLLRAIHANWPKTEILARGNSHYIIAVPKFSTGIGPTVSIYILGVAPTTTLRRHIEGLEASTKVRFEVALRRFKEFFDGAPSWSRVERIIARVEGGAEGPDTRFIVTNLKTRNARVLCEDVYCQWGQAENHWRPTVPRARRLRRTNSAVPTRRSLLDHVGSARIDAQALNVARRAVRHVAPSAHQSRRPHCRAHPGYSACRAWAHTVPRHLSAGA
jgi:hypothetical protein